VGTTSARRRRSVGTRVQGALNVGATRYLYGRQAEWSAIVIPIIMNVMRSAASRRREHPTRTKQEVNDARRGSGLSQLRHAAAGESM